MLYCRIVFSLIIAILSVTSWLVRTDDVSAQQLFNHNPQLGGLYSIEATRSVTTRFQRVYAAHALHALGVVLRTENLFSRTRTFISKLMQDRPLTAVQAPQMNKPVYKIGGQVSGLLAPVTLLNNAEDALHVQPGDTADFWFSKAIASGERYAVTAHSQEGSGQYCFISPSGSGIVTTNDVDDIRIMCSQDPSNNPFLVRPGGGGGGGSLSQATYTIGGVVSNLAGTLTLQNNNGDDLVLNESGSFIFSTSLANGTSYSVTVRTNPSSPAQICDVSNGSGSVNGSSSLSVLVTCRTIPVITLNAFNKTYGDAPFSMAATTTCDGAVTYTSSDVSVASMSGSIVTIVGAGTATIIATQATSTLYAATSTSAILTVARATPVIAALSSVSVNSARYSGICFEDFDAATFCTLDTPLRIDLPTSTSNGAFTSLTASNTDVIATSTPGVSYVLGYPVFDAAFLFPLEFDAFSLLTPGPFTTTATLHQATTTNYTAGSVSFAVTVELTNEDPEGNTCFNQGVMLRTPYDTYECSCPSTFTGQYCQTVIP